MSRSRNWTPVAGMTGAPSEKDDKRRANRKLRRKTKSGDPENPPALRVVSDVWSMAKDGKRYLDLREPGNEKWMRK